MKIEESKVEESVGVDVRLEFGQIHKLLLEIGIVDEEAAASSRWI